MSKIIMILALAIAILGSTFVYAADNDSSNGATLLVKRVRADVRTANVIDLKLMVDMIETNDLKELYEYAVEEGQVESVKTLDEALFNRKPELFKAPNSFRESMIVKMIVGKDEKRAKDTMLPLLLSLGARGDRKVSYSGSSSSDASLIYASFGTESLLTWVVRFDPENIVEVAKTVPSTEDGLRALQRARKTLRTISPSKGVQTPPDLLDQYIEKITADLIKAGVEKDLSDEFPSSVVLH